MGKRGRPLRPTHLRVLDGNPGKRPINENEPRPTGEAQPPEYLTNDALAVWIRVVSSMPPGFYAATDTELLANWCATAALNAEAIRHVQAIKEKPDADNIGLLTAWWKQFRETQAQMLTLSSRLGLSPADRASLKVSPSEKPAGKFAGLTGARSA